MNITRWQFLRALGGGALAIGLLPINSGCGDDEASKDDGDGDGDDVSCVNNGTAAAIAGNHGHALVVSKEDVAAGAEKTYSIQGTSNHDHSVTLTAAHFTSLKANTSVTVTSSAGTHDHGVTVSCA